VGTVTGDQGWLHAASTIQEKHWQLIIAVGLTVVMSVLSAIRTRLVTRVMTISLAIGYLGFLAAFLILLFTSHHHFVNTVNSFSEPFTHKTNTYQATA
jgi:hypothetical protein